MTRYCLILLFLIVSSPLRVESEFLPVVGPIDLEFPKDHGSHDKFETEWWYFTGHLSTKEKRTFGFELTFFRVGNQGVDRIKSSWKMKSIYLTHFALTDDREKKFYHAERLGRGAFGLAGARENTLSVWNGPWKAELRGDSIYIDVMSEIGELHLELSPSKPLVLQGNQGFSRKGEEKGQASIYFSYTRLRGEGSLKLLQERYAIDNASVWMDHEITSSRLAHGVNGWDWFAVQLENNTEIMLYQLREKDGGVSPYSSGVIVDSSGKSTQLASNDFSIEVLDYWKSKETNIKYPSKWLLKVPRAHAQFTVVPTVADQELNTRGTTQNVYWEGRSKVSGTMSGKDLEGDAYVELVGYEKSAAVSLQPTD